MNDGVYRKIPSWDYGGNYKKNKEKHLKSTFDRLVVIVILRLTWLTGEMRRFLNLFNG